MQRSSKPCSTTGQTVTGAMAALWQSGPSVGRTCHELELHTHRWSRERSYPVCNDTLARDVGLSAMNRSRSGVVLFRCIEHGTGAGAAPGRVRAGRVSRCHGEPRRSERAHAEWLQKDLDCTVRGRISAEAKLSWSCSMDCALLWPPALYCFYRRQPMC